MGYVRIPFTEKVRKVAFDGLPEVKTLPGLKSTTMTMQCYIYIMLRCMIGPPRGHDDENVDHGDDVEE